MTNITAVRELDDFEIDEVNGGIVPALLAAYYAAQYITVAYSATQIAFGAGAAVGAAATVYAAVN
jgi:hypothetical protein